MTIYGYARVSADGPSLGAQCEVLKAAGCETIFHETVGGAKADRLQFGRLLATINEGDAVVVARLDRFARSIRELLNILDTLAKRGVTFRSLGDQWADTTTPDGGAMPAVLGGLAEFERQLIRTRTSDGRARAMARGQRTGRPPTLTSRQRQEAIQALRLGTETQAGLARRFNVSQSTISRLAEKATPLPPTVRPTLDAETERAVRAFMQRLEGRYAIREGILFGSRARRTHTADSDADIAVVLKGEPGNRSATVREMAGIAFDVMLETGVMVEALPLWEDEFERPESFSNPALIQTIRREGLRL